MTADDGAGREVLPRSILVADDDVYRGILGDPKSVHLLQDPDAMVIPRLMTPAVNATEVLRIREYIANEGLLARNALLVKSPYEVGVYEPAESAIEAFASAKYDALVNVAQLLGAERVRVLDTRVDQSTTQWKAGLTAKLPIGGGRGSARREVEKRIEGRLQAEWVFPGSAGDPERATEYLRRHRLTGDQDLRHLIQRRSAEDNLVQSQRVVVNGTREAATNLTAALGLANVTPAKLKIGAQFTRTFQSISKVEIETEITFPKR